MWKIGWDTTLVLTLLEILAGIRVAEGPLTQAVKFQPFLRF